MTKAETVERVNKELDEEELKLVCIYGWRKFHSFGKNLLPSPMFVQGRIVKNAT